MIELSAGSQPPHESTINMRVHHQERSLRDVRTSARVAILSGILFLSGIGALIFETLWLRLSGLAFGNSVWATALILSSFMAGLALGNALAAASSIRRWRPLHLYAVLEVLVAFFGCTIVFALPQVGELLRPAWQTLWSHQPMLLGLRFVVSFVILLVPTTAMGLTLPVIIEDAALRQANFGRAIGFLYGSNTLGAVAGAVLGEMFLIAAFGLRGAAVAAGLALCIAATIALLVARFGVHVRALESGDISPHPKFPLRFDVSYRLPWRLLFISFGTGCILLCLEVVWFRFLRLYVASSPTAFAIMLAVVLAGVGIGGVVAGAIPRLNRLVGVILLCTAATMLLCYLLFPEKLAQTRTGAFDLSSTTIALLSLALMFPVAFLSGILFPVIAANVQASVGDRMNSTGLTTLFNTAGAAVGPLLASLVLLPGIGYHWSLLLCAAGYLLLCFIGTERSNWSIWRPVGLVTNALCAGAILLIGIVSFHDGEAHLSHASRPYETEDQGHVVAHVVKRIEGPADTWQLLRRDLFGEPYYYRLLANAFSMSATHPHSQRYMRLFAYLPLAFRPESEHVLLLCYGCGVTADALLHGPNVKQMEVVDVSKEVFRLADFYSGVNYPNPLLDSRVTTFVQDGRFFLQASPRQYDIITGEPPPPKVAGAVNLYTQEFFSLMKSRLKQDGIATFWLPINQLKTDEAKAILRAFHNVFSNASVWASADREWIMMGMNGSGRKLQEEEIRQLWRHTDSGGDLRRIGMEVPQQLGALFVMDGEEIDRITHDVSPLTDNYPKRLSDTSWDEEASHRFAFRYLEAPSCIQRFLHSTLIKSIWPEQLNESLESFFVLRQTRYLSEAIGSNKLAELDLYLRRSNLRIPILEVLGSDGFRLGIAERVAKQSQTPPPEAIPDLVAGALARRDVDGAIRLLENQKDRGGFNLNDTFLLTYLYCLSGTVDKAEALAANSAGSIKKDWFVDWLWGKLEQDFEFHAPK
jgi:predicted membrane-bound spermidine synthase